MKNLGKLLLIGLLSPGILQAAAYDPAILSQIAGRVLQARAQGEKPVLVFDIDDTLTDSRVRTRKILMDYGNNPSVQQADPADASRLANAPYAAMRFSIANTLQALGVEQPQFAAAATQFWIQQFFSNNYCAIDPPIPGAAEYVDWIHRLGGFIVYLTGRSQPDMQTCTEYGLLRHHFAGGEGTLLMMKPAQNIPDLEFKQQAFARILTLGTIVAGFENEPANINAYQAAFPGAFMVFLNTIQSNNGVAPNPGIAWIPDFLITQ